MLLGSLGPNLPTAVVRQAELCDQCNQRFPFLLWPAFFTQCFDLRSNHSTGDFLVTKGWSQMLLPTLVGSYLVCAYVHTQPHSSGHWLHAWWLIWTTSADTQTTETLYVHYFSAMYSTSRILTWNLLIALHRHTHVHCSVGIIKQPTAGYVVVVLSVHCTQTKFHFMYTHTYVGWLPRQFCIIHLQIVCTYTYKSAAT